MSRDILQRFLGRKLFDIGAEDARLDRLRRAASDLGASLRASPPLAVRYALVAFDPNVAATEPVFDDVATAVERHWNTYASCFADTPRTAFRAVLLSALERVAGESVGIATAVALLARNLLPHLVLGAEWDLWSEFITAADVRLEERARAEWSIGVEPGPYDGIGLELGGGSRISAPKSDRSALTQAFAAATGPQNQQGQHFPSPNPQWPHQGPQWAYEFAPRAAAAVAEAIDKAISAAMRPLAGLETAIAENLEGAVSDALAAALQPARGLRRRSELLWWKEAVYSPSGKVSYRSLSPVGAAVLMAIDLHGQVPPFCPASVEFFLREVVGLVASTDGTSGAKPLKKLVNDLTLNGGPPAPIRTALASFRQASGRGPLIALLSDLFEGGKASPDRILSSVGITGDIKMTLPDLSVWIFRELQATAAVVAEPLTTAASEESAEVEEEA